MKRTTLALLFMASALLPAVYSESIEADSNITSVSLFRDGARVTRVGKVQAPAGKSTIRFESLPSSVDTQTLEATIGDALGLVRNAKIYLPEDPSEDEEVEAIKEELEAKRREIRNTLEEKSMAKSRLKFVEDLAESFADGYGELAENGSSLTLEQGLKTWELVDKTKREVAETEESVDRKVRELSKEEDELKNELRKAQEKATLTRSVAEVEIELDEAQEVEVSLSYQALSARWQAQYELRAHPSEARLDFGYFANIWQHTGEDWKDVELSLHTNQANRRGNVPELAPLVLREQPVRYANDDNQVFELSPFETAGDKRKSARLSNSAAPSQGYADGNPISQQRIAVTSSTVSFQVTLPGSVSVLSAKENATIPVTKTELKAEFWSEVVPKVQLDTYLRARAINEMEIPILPGTALAFVDGKLSSKVVLEKTLPSEKLELSLGTDSNIVVERIEGAQLDKESGVFEKSKVLTRSYTNKVTNYHPVSHKVVVVDQFPISSNAKIEVTRLTPDESAIKVLEDQKDSGLFRWEEVLPAGATETFEISYKVEHPRDWYLGPAL